MPRGGKRDGAGRPVGVLSKKTIARRELADKALAKGKSPLEVMLANMRHFDKLAESAEAVLTELSAETVLQLEPAEQFKFLLAKVKEAAGLREMAQTCARDAAAFIHPKLSTIESNLTVHDKRDVADWSRDELVAVLNDARKSSGRAASANGRGDKPDQIH